MNGSVRLIIVVLAALLGFAPEAARAQSGPEIMQKERDLHHVKDEEERQLVDMEGFLSLRGREMEMGLTW